MLFAIYMGPVGVLRGVWRSLGVVLGPYGSHMGSAVRVLYGSYIESPGEDHMGLADMAPQRTIWVLSERRRARRLSPHDGEHVVFSEHPFEAVFAALLEAEGGVGLGVLLERRGDDDLTAVCAAGDAGAEHDVAPVELLFAHDHKAGVQADAQPQRALAARDRALAEGALQVERAAQRRVGAVERDHEAVVVRLRHRAPVVKDELLDDRAVVAQQLLCALGPQLLAD